MVVAAEPEAYLVAGDSERAFDVVLRVSIHLVQNWLLEAGRTVGRTENQIALRVDAGAGAVDAPGDAAGVGAGGDDKVVLQLALTTVKDQIHAGVDLGIVDLAISLDAGAPVLGVVTDEVAHYAGLRVQSYHGGLGICADQGHAQGVDGGAVGCLRRWLGRCRLLPLQVQDDLARSEEERVAGTAREELNVGCRLPLVGLETQWHAHELRLPGRRGGAQPARTEEGRNYRERRCCPKCTRPMGSRRPMARHTDCSSLSFRIAPTVESELFFLFFRTRAMAGLSWGQLDAAISYS